VLEDSLIILPLEVLEEMVRMVQVVEVVVLELLEEEVEMEGMV